MLLLANQCSNHKYTLPVVVIILHIPVKLFLQIFYQTNMSRCQPNQMKVKMIVDPMMYNKYPNEDVEHFLSYRGRPFICLVSQKIPTPPTTLIDYNLAKALKMKIFDLQYKKFLFCGNKLRILGRVSISVYIHERSRSFHMKANVIDYLNKSIGCEILAGLKLKSMLERSSPPTSAQVVDLPGGREASEKKDDATAEPGADVLSSAVP